MLTMSSCKTCPNQNDPEIREYLIVDLVPELKIFDFKNPELKKILTMQNEEYSVLLLFLLSMKDTGMFISVSLDEEIIICKENIKWIQDTLNKIEMLD